MKFKEELKDLLNRHKQSGVYKIHYLESESNTPDFILAQYIKNCLSTFAEAIQQRETWYGRDARPRIRKEGIDTDGSYQRTLK